MNQTIAAVATGEGRTAIGVIRLSGPDAIAAAAAVVRTAGGGSFADAPPRTLIYGTLLGADGAPVDRGLAVLFRAPHSYTGEDAAELHCHGAPVVIAMVLEALFAQGVRQAQPGEFTRRALLAGKLDLLQAEAVIDLIDAQTPDAARAAHGQLTGALTRRTETIYSGLVDVLAHFHAVLDYPDEELDPFRTETIAAALDTAEAGLVALLASYERGRYLTRGVPCAIVGAPNAGKSSLLNALLGYDRAIVTALPGTTRDTVEETCTLGGVLLRLIDTAGLRECTDAAERIGVQRSRTALQEAALVLVVLDGSKPIAREDETALAEAEAAPRVVCVVNKSDRAAAVDADALRVRFPHLCVLSATTGTGLDELERLICGLFPRGGNEERGALLTNARQFAAAQEAAASVKAAQEALRVGVSPDAVLTDVELAVEAIGALTGRTVREDVIARVFERFCVGK